MFPEAAGPDSSAWDTDALAEEALGDHENGARQREQRRHERARFDATVLVYELEQDGTAGAGTPGKAMNLSRSGMGILSKRVFYPNRTVIVLVPLPNAEQRLLCGTIRSCFYTHAGLYHVGVEFCAMPAGEKFEVWKRERLKHP